MPYPPIKNEVYSLLGGINNKVSLYQSGPQEFRDISNLNFSSVGALSKRPGSALYIGATLGGRITGGVEFNRLNGASYIVVTSGTNAYTVSGNVFSAFRSGLLNNAVFNFTNFVDRLFCSNGQDFFKFDGSNSYLYSLPPGLTASWGVTAVIGGGLSGTYVAAYGYLNERGYLGPPSNGITITLNGVTYGSIQYVGLTAPTGYGITAIQLYRTAVDFPNLFGTTLAVGSATGATDTGFPLTSEPAPTYQWFTLMPKFTEIFNNQLFLGGFSAIPSTAYWSDIGEPEGVEPEFFNEFRTNDGGGLTGFKSYNGALVVTKEKSFHLLSGTDPSNFSVQQLSDQYGCISHRSMVVFENLLWFLDTKGVCEWNGANIKIVSNKIENIFKSMNLAAARDNACALHFKEFNEVWFSFPINGATMNNVTAVFDYVAEGWTKYEGFNASVLFQGVGTLPNRSIFYGGYSGNLFNFGQSLFSDNGSAITCMVDSAYIASIGETVTKQYRRFYMNVDAIPGSSQAIDIQFTQDFNQGAVAATGTIYQSPFQTRLDFGIPAKAINFKATHVSATLPFRLNGFGFESRFQRNV